MTADQQRITSELLGTVAQALRSLGLFHDIEANSEAHWVLCKLVLHPKLPPTHDERCAWVYVIVRRTLNRLLGKRSGRRMKTCSELGVIEESELADLPSFDHLFSHDNTPDRELIREREAAAARRELEEYTQDYAPMMFSKKQYHIMAARRKRKYGDAGR